MLRLEHEELGALGDLLGDLLLLDGFREFGRKGQVCLLGFLLFFTILREIMFTLMKVNFWLKIHFQEKMIILL